MRSRRGRIMIVLLALPLAIVAVALVGHSIFARIDVAKRRSESSPERIQAELAGSAFSQVSYTCREDLSVHYDGVMQQMHGVLGRAEAERLHGMVVKAARDVLDRGIQALEQALGALSDENITNSDIDRIGRQSDVAGMTTDVLLKHYAQESEQLGFLFHHSEALGEANEKQSTANVTAIVGALLLLASISGLIIFRGRKAAA